jgi:hypothetical protein
MLQVFFFLFLIKGKFVGKIQTVTLDGMEVCETHGRKPAAAERLAIVGADAGGASTSSVKSTAGSDARGVRGRCISSDIVIVAALLSVEASGGLSSCNFIQDGFQAIFDHVDFSFPISSLRLPGLSVSVPQHVASVRFLFLAFDFLLCLL